MILLLITFTGLWFHAHTLDNGLARTPPMGWMTWQRYRCQVDCVNYPDDCLSESLIKRTADRLAEDGWKEAGYRYLIIDDCWPAKQRDRATEELVSDPVRFPKGMGYIGEYVHSKGLLFGIYLDYGTYTCAGYPGSMNYLKVDAQSLEKWKVDYVKVDGCYSPTSKMPAGYEEFGQYLNQTGRPMVYSCSYPAYIDWQTNSSRIDWERLKKNCHLWRMLYDINDNWDSVMGIINIYKKQQSVLQPLAGPGHWNDPDMLILGNYGLSKDQQRAQMGMWCMFAAPLLISADMDNMDPFSADLLRNPNLVAIDQDVGGHQARFIAEQRGVQLWTRQLAREPNTWAIAFLNPHSGGGPTHLPITLKELDINSPSQWLDANTQFTLTDVFDGSVFGVVKADERFTVYVNPTGITMYHVKAKKTEMSMADMLNKWNWF